jgi:hypothetical protein
MPFSTMLWPTTALTASPSRAASTSPASRSRILSSDLWLRAFSKEVQRDSAYPAFNSWLGLDNVKALVRHVDIVVQSLNEEDDEPSHLEMYLPELVRSCSIHWQGFRMINGGLSALDEKRISAVMSSLDSDIVITSINFDGCLLELQTLLQHFLSPLQGYHCPAISFEDSAIEPARVPLTGDSTFAKFKLLRLLVKDEWDGETLATVEFYRAFPAVEEIHLRACSKEYWTELRHLPKLKHLNFVWSGIEESDDDVFEALSGLSTLEVLQINDAVCETGETSETALLSLPPTLKYVSLGCYGDLPAILAKLLQSSSFLPALKHLNMYPNADNLDEDEKAIASCCKARSIRFTLQGDIFNSWVA